MSQDINKQHIDLMVTLLREAINVYRDKEDDILVSSNIYDDSGWIDADFETPYIPWSVRVARLLREIGKLDE